MINTSNTDYTDSRISIVSNFFLCVNYEKKENEFSIVSFSSGFKYICALITTIIQWISRCYSVLG